MATPGIHKVTVKGQAYYYAWRGGPRLHSQPHTPEFLAEWQAHLAVRSTEPRSTTGTLQDIISAYKASAAFLGLATASRATYTPCIKRIEDEYGDLPTKALGNPAMRGIMLDWRDDMSRKHARQADYCLSVLQAILSWAWDRRRIPAHPLERNLGRVWKGTRRESVYTDDDLATVAAMPAHLRLPALIAIETAQRQANILHLKWSAYDGRALNVHQSKTGTRITVPVSTELRALLDVTPRSAVTICTTLAGKPWTVDGFKSSWAKVRLPGLTFHDFRGTAITRFAKSGCTTPEIAAISGLSLASINAILEKHYLQRDPAIAESAIRKLEMHKTRTRIVK